MVWMPKYRKHVLKGKIKERLKELIFEIADEY
ncbi:transposase [Persephonella sp.]